MTSKSDTGDLAELRHEKMGVPYSHMACAHSQLSVLEFLNKAMQGIQLFMVFWQKLSNLLIQ